MHLLTATADATFASALNTYLARFGYTMHVGVSGPALPAQLAARPVDLVLLDLAPRDADALATAHALRRCGDTPFIILGNAASSADRVAGLNSGAADYLAKPFQPRELVARIRSVLRRTGAPGTPSPAAEPADPSVHFDGGLLQTLTRQRASSRSGPRDGRCQQPALSGPVA